MKKIMLIFMTAVLFMACKSQDATTTAPATTTSQEKAPAKVFPYPIQQTELENGLNVVTVPYNSPGIAAFYIVVRVGSRDEIEEGKTGFAHFFEHMMFRGTEKYPTEEYGRSLKSLGAGANANTWLDRTVYHMTGNADKLEKMFELESDRFLNLKYSVADFKVEAGAVKGEYTKNFASQYRQMNELLMKTAFKEHTYSHTTMGFFEDIVDMPNQYEYSQIFYDRFYRPEYTTILVVGDADHNVVVELSEQYFGEWERGTYSSTIPVEPVQQETRYAHIQNAGFIPMLTMAYKTPAYSDTTKNLPALDLISSLLFSQRSDLYKKLIVEEQKLLNLAGYNYSTRDPFLFEIDALAKNEDDLQYVKDEIVKALEDLKKNLVDKKLLEETKSHMKYSLTMSLDNPDAIANYLSYYIWLTGNPTSLDKYYQMLDMVTPKDIQEVAQKYFTPERLTIATISSKAEGGVK